MVRDMSVLGKIPREEQELMLSAIADRATAVIGNRPEAMRWMGTPVPALDYATPISLLHSKRGVDKVLTVLGRIEHGIF
jgi:putative toxin-antitoxin system antitoxin component (TIGR02293 family)